MEELHLEDLGKYDPTRVDTEIRVASSILIYTLHTGRTYNMWRFQGVYRYDMMMHLHALVTVISMELFIAAIESFGVGVNDAPGYRDWETDRKSTRLNSSHSGESRMPSSA